MYKSFGEIFFERFCINGLTPPILARALGMWLGDLERIMVSGDPPKPLVDKLIELSSNPGCWMFNIQPLSSDDIWKAIVDWDLAPKEDRTTITESTWTEPPVLQEADVNPGSDKVEWLRNHPAFTIDAWRETWGHSQRAAEDYLTPRRWKPNRESHGAKMLTVWRWNPLNEVQPSGRPVALYFQPQSDVSMKGALQKHFQDKLQKLLDDAVRAGVKQAKIQEVAQVFYGREITNSNTLQKLRNKMVTCGWEYNLYDKVWRPKDSK